MDTDNQVNTTKKIKLPKEAKDILTKLKKAGFEAYAVGGSVRDEIIGKKTKDWDFTTNAPPEEILKLFPDSFYDNKFGTVGVPIKKDKETQVYEITTYRSEHGFSDHRHPDKILWGGTLVEDLKRRDFTINALAFDGVKLIDLFDGLKDLKNKIMRAVGDPDKRFTEDALRMMRAIRFATQLQFIIDEKTFSAIRKNAKLISTISGERIRDELFLILESAYPADGIKLLRNASLLGIILPELDKCFTVEQKSPKRHHVHDVGTHLLLSLKHCPSKDPIVRFATLFHDVGKPVTYKKTADGVVTFYNHEIMSTSIARNIAEKLHLSKKDRERILTLIRYHQFTVDERQTDSAVRRFIKNIGKDNLEDMLDLRTGDRLGGGAAETSWRLELFKKRLSEVQKQPFTTNDLKVDGNDIMKIYNIGPGPLVGSVLTMLFTDVVEGKVKNEREPLLTRIKQLKNIIINRNKEK